MSLATRKPQLKQMQVTPLLTKHGTLTQAEVRSTSGKLYHVAMPELVYKHNGHYEYRVSCHCKSDIVQLPVCKGNSRHTVCKHSIASIKHRLQRIGVHLSIVEDVAGGKRLSQAEQQAHAERLARIGGCVISIKSNNGSGRVWAVGRRMQ